MRRGRCGECGEYSHIRDCAACIWCACTRCTEAAQATGFHGKLDVDVGEVGTGGDIIPMASLFLSQSVILFSRHGGVHCDSFFP